MERGDPRSRGVARVYETGIAAEQLTYDYTALVFLPRAPFLPSFWPYLRGAGTRNPEKEQSQMAEESAKLRIPYIAAAQAQKHVTHNEGMTLLDTLVQLRASSTKT